MFLHNWLGYEPHPLCLSRRVLSECTQIVWTSDKISWLWVNTIPCQSNTAEDSVSVVLLNNSILCWTLDSVMTDLDWILEDSQNTWTRGQNPAVGHLHLHHLKIIATLTKGTRSQRSEILAVVSCKTILLKTPTEHWTQFGLKIKLEENGIVGYLKSTK